MATDSPKWSVDDIVAFSPRVTGGWVVARVIAVLFTPLFGYSYRVLITDGTRVWRTGSTECVTEDMLDR